MKIQLLTLMMGMILLMAIMPTFVSSEIYLWNSVVKDNVTSVVKYHAFYFFDDTSAKGIGKQKDVPLTLMYQVQSLPLTLDSGNQIDWCNLTISHYHNIYGTTFIAWQGFLGGELLNTTTTTQNLYFNSGSSSDKITINMRDKDYLTATFTCHYTNNTNLYEKNILAGNFATYMPSFECEGCSQYSLEELSQQTEKQSEITTNELAIYDKIQIAIDWNFQIWLILSWILKIAFIFVGIGLIFASVYYFYIFFKKLGEAI